MKSRPGIRFLHLAFAWSLVATTVEARIWYIRPDGTGDAATIQAGIDSAQAGDEVVLAPGAYTWTLQAASGPSMIRMKRDVTLRGEGQAAGTILDAQQQGRVVFCSDVGGTRIENLTITGGRTTNAMYPPSGAGIYSAGDSRPTIAGCIVRGNVARGEAGGGGIYCTDAAIVGCEILDNEVEGQETGRGGGVFCVNTMISGCTIRGNEVYGGDGAALGAGVFAYGSRLSDCRIEHNVNHGSYFAADGGGVYAYGSLSLMRCTLVANEVRGSRIATGAAVECYDTGTIAECVFARNACFGNGASYIAPWGGTISGGALVIRRCTLIGNSVVDLSPAPFYPPVSALRLGSGSSVASTIVAYSQGGTTTCAGSATFTCTVLFSNTAGDAICGTDAGGNFSADPQFCAADPASSLNVTIQSDSPCAPGNHPDGASCGLIGAGPVGCGTVSVQLRTWTGVKSLYR